MLKKVILLTTLAVALTVRVHAEHVVGLTTNNSLAIMDGENPTNVLNVASITGVQAGDQIIAIDYNLESGDLLGLGQNDFLYDLDPVTGAATLIGTGALEDLTLDGNIIFEIDPILNIIRALDGNGTYALINPVLGIVQSLLDEVLLYQLDDVNFGTVPEVVSGAIDNLNILEEDQGIFYLIDKKTSSVVQLVTGLINTLDTIAPITGIENVENIIGFDISEEGLALIGSLLENGLGTEILNLNLIDGATTLLGTINLILRDITILPTITGLDSDGDGVPNESDQCPETPEGTVVDSQGCSIMQNCPCEGPRAGGVYKNKNGYKKCVKQQGKRFMKSGLITKQERKIIIKSTKTTPCTPAPGN